MHSSSQSAVHHEGSRPGGLMTSSNHILKPSSLSSEYTSYIVPGRINRAARYSSSMRSLKLSMSNLNVSSSDLPCNHVPCRNFWNGHSIGTSRFWSLKSFDVPAASSISAISWCDSSIGHSFLCALKSFLWQSLEQYQTDLHFPQYRRSVVIAQDAQTLLSCKGKMLAADMMETSIRIDDSLDLAKVAW